MCKVSYIVPVYNAQDTLLRCVESLAYGQERDCEIILSEDCSKDDSWSVCLKLQQQFSNVVCIQNEHNSGVSHTRNAALDVAKGEYIMFVDSDDWVSSEYASTLLSVEQQHKNQFVVCGFHYIDRMAKSHRDYVWDRDSNDDLYILERNRFFELIKEVLIQQSVCKLFRRDVIEKAHIRFDETQSMGEDFEFVLDYMKAAACERCVIVNKPLYSYIRANNTSLMSKFGFDKELVGVKRMDKLLTVCGETDSIAKLDCEKAKAGLLKNYAYQITRAKQLTKEEKISYLTALYDSDTAVKMYAQQRMSIFKEQMVERVLKFKNIRDRIIGRIQREKNNWIIKHVKESVGVSNITLISQNCIGGVFYHDAGMKFQSPTINLFFMAKDFLRFVSDLKHYLTCELEMRWGLDYPIGTLDDIEVHFMHYESCEQAKNDWNRRKERIQWDRIVILSTDRNGFGEDEFEAWNNIAYPKVLFTANPKFAKRDGVVYYPQYRENGMVEDLIPKREFYKDGVLLASLNGVAPIE